MALIAFDLDNTLGYFSHVGVWADFFSVDTLENSLNHILNPKFKISDKLRETLETAEKLYMDKILNSKAILKTTLRPNLDAMIKPLIKAKKAGKVRAICIYSNTWNTFSVDLGKMLIESIYSAPNLFDAVVDASHPIRKDDWGLRKQGNQIKTFRVLKSIFRDLCSVKDEINPSDILFVDERPRKHVIQESETDGLTYLKPSVYLPDVSMHVLKEVFTIGLEVLKESGLSKNETYLDSDVFHCLKYGGWHKNNEFIPIGHMHELLETTESLLKSLANRGVPFIDDTHHIKKVIGAFLI
jgi:predicted phosphatase